MNKNGRIVKKTGDAPIGTVVIDPKGTRYVVTGPNNLLGCHKLPIERLGPELVMALLTIWEEAQKLKNKNGTTTVPRKVILP